jgi:hypothetical protein
VRKADSGPHDRPVESEYAFLIKSWGLLCTFNFEESSAGFSYNTSQQVRGLLFYTNDMLKRYCAG